MIKPETNYSGLVVTAPLVIGAFLSGALALAEGASIPITIFQITLIYAFLYFVIYKIARREIEVEVYGLEKYYLIFLCLIFFSLIYTPERDQAIFYSIRVIVLVLMTYLIFNTVKSTIEVKYIAFTAIGIASILSAYTIIQTYYNPEIIALNYMNVGKNIMRARGTETDPNIFAINFAMPIMFLVAFFNSSEKKFYKVGYLVLLGVILATVLITYSRSAWISLFVGIMIVLHYQKNYKIILYSVLIFAVLILFSSTLQNLAVTIFERFLNIFAGSEDDSSNIRILLAIGAIRMFMDSYMIGIGFQGFSTNFKDYYTPQETIGIYEPHNEYYTVLAELGLFGFIIFGIIIWKLFSWSFKSIRISKGSKNAVLTIALTASLTSYLIFYMFYGGMLYNSLLMINIGLMFTLYHINLKLTNSKNSLSVS